MAKPTKNIYFLKKCHGMTCYIGITSSQQVVEDIKINKIIPWNTLMNKGAVMYC